MLIGRINRPEKSERGGSKRRQKNGRGSKRETTAFSRPALAAFLLLGLIAVSCQGEEDTGVVFGESRLHVADKTISVFLAITPPQREQGLKYRRHLPRDMGMYFIYPQPVRTPFWMKDTLIPLSIAFIDSRGEIVSIQKMAPDNGETFYHSPRPFQYVLEMNQGWFEENQITEGAVVKLPD